MRFRYLLAVETSCDDCCAALLNEKGDVCAEVIYSLKNYSKLFGGIIPEVAARHHISIISLAIETVIRKSLNDYRNIDVIAVSHRPGLVGSLLIGSNTCKGMGVVLGIPIIGVNHIEGHLFCGYGDDKFLEPPFIGAIFSGGHSSIYLCDEKFKLHIVGETRDDSVGEIFDKVGHVLGLSYPSGRLIDHIAKQGYETKLFSFPNIIPQDKVNYSFSGLKTAIKIMLNKLNKDFNEFPLANFCYEFQRHVICELLKKLRNVCEIYGLNKLVLGGGVVSNSFLRQEIAKISNINIYIPPCKYSTDNAVMIGRAGILKARIGTNVFEDFFVFSS